MYFCPNWDKVLLDEVKRLNYDDFYLSGTMIEPNSGHIVCDFGINLDTFKEDELLSRYKSINFYDHQGTHFAPHLVSKKMINNQDGRIINIVGDSSRIGEANLAITAAARGGTIALGKSLAKEFGRYSITVNTISLGLVKTSHTDNDILEKNMDKILKSYPIKRLGKTSDVAPMVIFLSSKHAEWITGQTFSINGGYSMI